MQSSPVAPPPSIRFYDSKRNVAGAIMAILAAVFTFATWMWPIAVPQARGSLGFAWGMGALFVSVAYLAGFFLADKHWTRARLILIGAAVLHIAGGLLSGLLADANEVSAAVPAAMFDIAPALVGLAAGLLIHAPPSPAEYRAHRDADRERV
jgi:ABC-type Fe3+-siderophore transport system permease subunit